MLAVHIANVKLADDDADDNMDNDDADNPFQASSRFQGLKCRRFCAAVGPIFRYLS